MTQGRTFRRTALAAGVILGALLLGLALYAWFSPVQELAMPDHLDLGTLRQGAVVEINIRLLTSARSSPLERAYDTICTRLPRSWGAFLSRLNPRLLRAPPALVRLDELKPTIRAPDFLRVTGVEPIQRTNWFQGQPFFSIDFLVDTHATGELTGAVVGQLGRRRATLPIRLRVVESSARPGLVVVSPFMGDGTEKGGDLDTVVGILSRLPGRCDFVLKLPEDFTGCGIVLAADAPLASLTEYQARRLREFIDGGGRVILCCNAFFRGTVARANLVAEPYGISVMDSDGVTGLALTNIASDPLTANVSQLAFHRPSPVILKGPQARSLVSTSDGTSYAAVSRTVSGGEVIVLSQSLWWWWVQQFRTNSDNGVFLANLLARSPGAKLSGAIDE